MLLEKNFFPWFFENVFTWYCCGIGIIGNTLTCILLARRILKFKKNSKKNNQQDNPTNVSDNPTTATATNNNNKKIDLDRKHNWALYVYFIGINISDLIVLINWSLSKINIKIKPKNKIEFVSDQQTLADLNLFVNFEDITDNFDLSSQNLTSCLHVANKSATNFLINSSCLKMLQENGQPESDEKLINLQGVCQLYYYLTIVSFFASFSYTLAALLDRLFKINVIYADFYQQLKRIGLKSISSNSDELFNIKSFKSSKRESIATKSNDYLSDVYDENENLNEIILSNCDSDCSLRQEDAKESKLKNFKKSSKQPKSSRISMNHSELVRQLFGKKSAAFLTIFIIFFNYHLLWIYGSDDSVNLFKVGPIPYEINATRAGTINERSQMGFFKIMKSQPYCQLLNVRNEMAFFVMIFDLFLLIILPILKLIACVLLITTYKKLQSSNFYFNYSKKMRKLSNELSDLKRSARSKISSLKTKEEHTTITSAQHSAKPSIVKLNESSIISKKSILNANVLLGEQDYLDSASFILKSTRKNSSIHSLKFEKCLSTIRKTRNRYFVIKCIIYTTIFGVFFSLPSIITRNVLMIVITINSFNTIPDAKSVPMSLLYTRHYNKTKLNYLNATLLNETQAGLSTVGVNNANGMNLAIIAYKLNGLCESLDYLLLTASSHKFIIFLYQCYLIKLPKRFASWRHKKNKFFSK